MARELRPSSFPIDYTQLGIAIDNIINLLPNIKRSHSLGYLGQEVDNLSGMQDDTQWLLAVCSLLSDAFCDRITEMRTELRRRLVVSMICLTCERVADAWTSLDEIERANVKLLIRNWDIERVSETLVDCFWEIRGYEAMFSNWGFRKDVPRSRSLR